MIGDSFAEGYGVNLNNTSQKYIEDLTGLNVLNFGVSNNFGVVQYYLIYTNSIYLLFQILSQNLHEKHDF